MAKDVYIRPTSISFLRICHSPATDMAVVACLWSVIFVSDLLVFSAFRRESAYCKAQISKAFVPLAELICALRSADSLMVVFITSSNLTHHLFFYFQKFLVKTVLNCREGFSVRCFCKNPRIRDTWNLGEKGKERPTTRFPTRHAHRQRRKRRQWMFIRLR